MSWSRRTALPKRLAAMVPALLLGTALGIAGGAWAAGTMDATPYGETDLNTISRQSQQAGSAEGWKQAQAEAARISARLKAASADRVDRLEAKLATAGRSAKDMKKQSADQDAKLAQMRSALAETTAALNNASSQASTGTADRQAIEGTLKSTWVLRASDKPWPQDCAKPLQTYQVRVTAGAGATISEAQLVGAGTKRTEKGKGKREFLTLTCSMTYTASIPTPLGDGYEVTVLDTSTGDTPVKTQSAATAALENGSGPAITVRQ